MTNHFLVCKMGFTKIPYGRVKNAHSGPLVLPRWFTISFVAFSYFVRPEKFGAPHPIVTSAALADRGKVDKERVLPKREIRSARNLRLSRAHPMVLRSHPHGMRRFRDGDRDKTKT